MTTHDGSLELLHTVVEEEVEVDEEVEEEVEKVVEELLSLCTRG